MFWVTTLLSSPSTGISSSVIVLLIFAKSASLRSFTRVSMLMPAPFNIFKDLAGPMPYLPLTLLVLGVPFTNHMHNALSADNFAISTHWFNRRSYFHINLNSLCSTIYKYIIQFHAQIFVCTVYTCIQYVTSLYL